MNEKEEKTEEEIQYDIEHDPDLRYLMIWAN